MNAAQVKATFEIDTKQAEEATNRVASAYNQMLLRAINAGAGLDQTTEKINIQSKYIKILEQDLEKLKQKEGDHASSIARKEIQIEKANLALQKLQTMQQNANLASLALEQGLSKVGNESQNLSNNIEKLNDDLKFEPLMGLGSKAFDFTTNVLSDFAKQTFIVATDYESSLNKMQAVNNLTADQMKEISSLAEKLGADMDLPATSAAGATNAMVELSQAGLSVEDSMNAAKSTLQLAAAAQLDEATAAQYTAAALNAFHIEGSKATKVVDMYAASLKSSGTNVNQMGDALQASASVFASAKVPIEDLMTAINMMGKEGIKGSDAGTSLKTMLIALQSPSTEAKNAMEALGIKIYDLKGNMLPMRDIVNQFSNATSNLTQQQKDQLMVTIFGTDAVRAGNIVLTQGVEAYDKMTKSVTETGVAQKLSEAQTKGLAGAIEGLKSQGETLITKVLVPILPALTEMVKGMATIVGFTTDNFIPALGTLTTALILYELHTKAAAISGAGGLLPYVIAQTTAFYNMAAGALAAAAPLALMATMALTVGALIYFIVDFNKGLIEQKNQMLQTRQSYVDATKALDDYKNASESVKQATSQEAKQLEQLTKLYDEKMARATGTGGYKNAFKSIFDNKEVFDQQIKELKDLEDQMNKLKDSMNFKMEISSSGASAIENSFKTLTNSVFTFKQNENGVFIPTEENAKKAADALKDLEKSAPSAFNQLITTEANFYVESQSRKQTHSDKLAELEQKKNNAINQSQLDAINTQIQQEQTAYNTQEQTAAISYAKQQEAQRQHLGQMLIDYIKAQALINKDYVDKAGELINFVSNQYGMVASSGDIAWGNNLKALNDYVSGGIGSLDELGGKFSENEKKAVANEVRMRELEKTYITKVELEYSQGKLTPEEYQEKLNQTKQVVTTQFNAETDLAEANAKKLEDQAIRVERTFNGDIKIDNSSAIASSLAVQTSIANIPKDVTTNAHLKAEQALIDSVNIGSQLMAGITQGINNSMASTATAMNNAVRNVINTAKATARIKSPSKVTDEEIGQMLQEGVTIGINKKKKVTEKEFKNGISALAKAYNDFSSKFTDLNEKHAAKLSEIWENYYKKQKEQLDKFNGDKFDNQLDFYSRIADLDSAARQQAYESQQKAWQESQALAQAGKGALADEYYNTALAQIEADQERAAKMNQIDQDIANKKKQLLEETDETVRASLQKEIEELESRKQFLEEVDAQQDKRDFEKLDEIKNRDDAIAKQRDESLAEENKDYTEAFNKLKEAYSQTIEEITEKMNIVIDAQNPLMNAFNENTNLISEQMKLIEDSFKSIGDAASDAASAANSGGGGSDESSNDNPEHRATGGSVFKNQSYIVGENEPELFIASRNGFIANSDQVLQAAKETGYIKQVSSENVNKHESKTYNHNWYIQNQIDYRKLAIEVKKLEKANKK